MAELPESLEPIGAVTRTKVGREATEPMREDIRLLGTILGDTVREQNGEEVFDLVEQARVESFRVRRSEIDRSELARLFDGIDIHQAIPVIRAFSHFALLANVAEDIHRERRRAVHVAAGEPPQNSTLAATYEKLDAAHLKPETVTDALQGALVSPVITAHPTETRRRTVFDTQHRITQLMRVRLHGQGETEDGQPVETELRRQILTLWQTALIRLSRLKIQDEIEVGLRYYPAAFFEVIPKVNAEVRDALRARWPGTELLAAPILRPGSWIGGDRDGNPNVTADVVRLATGSAAYTALGHYFAELTHLEQELSMSARLVKTTDDLVALADACNEPARTDEPYRRALRVVHARLTATAADILDRTPAHTLDLGLAAYATPAELRADLDVIDVSLRANGSALLADDRLARLRDAVEVFGFHLSSLDMRQNSEVHEEVIAELLSWAGVHSDYAALSEPERVELLAGELATRRPLVRDDSELSELARKELDIVFAAARAVNVFGPAAVPNYIISMCQSVSDMLEAAILLKEAGLLDVSGVGCRRRLRAGRHCAAVRNDRRPSARLGHPGIGAGPSALPSDGARPWREPGSHARLLGLQQGRRISGRQLGALSGRTGSGGVGPQDRNPAAVVPRSRWNGRPRWRSELRRDSGPAAGGGERVAAADRAGRDHRGQVRRAAHCPPKPGDAAGGDARVDAAGHRRIRDLAQSAYDVLDDLAARAQRAYAELVHETPGFVEYFKASTPVSEIGSLNIGSRPTSRKPTTSIADLRAIPWVLAWSQSRVMLPGWYGTGSAFEEWIAEGPKPGARLEVLQDLYVKWPFFATVLSNMAQVLAKSDLGLAARYSELVEDEELRHRVFDKIAAEHERTIRMHKLITGQDDLLADNPSLARSVFNRFPYLEPLNHLQVELLRRYRSGDEDELVQRGILLTMSGLASALRNSG